MDGRPLRPVIVRFVRSIALANGAGALLVSVYSQLLPPGKGAHRPGPHDFEVSMIVLGAYLLVSFAGLGAVMARRGIPATAWWAEGRRPTESERDAFLAQPLHAAAVSFVGWLGAAVVFGLLNLRFDPTGDQSVRNAINIVLGGATTSALVFLLTRRGEPEMTAEALAAGPPRRRMLGIRASLLLTWGLGSAIPLLAVVAAPAGVPRERWRMLVPALIVLAIVGIAAGGLLSWLMAGSLADPISRLRVAVGRVERGELDVEVAVDDVGEIGQLQAGFNLMVAGLRERERLNDLFGRHVGAEVARRALREGVALGGERREATALFVDVVGSTAMAQSNAPEHVVRVLNQFFDAVVRVVAAEGGWVNKFEGDGALCIFGAPVAEPDHAERGLRAARTLRQEMLALAATRPGFDAAIGISSGSVVAGNVGSEERFEYTVIGTPVNEAARLTDAAKERLGRVLASEEAVGRSGDERVNWAVAGEIRLRGIADPVLTYQPAAEAALRPAE